MKDLIKYLVVLRNYFVYKKYDFLAKIINKKLPFDDKVDFVVSIASYPKRDHLLPAVFQALTNQTVVPKKWILVLSVEDYLAGVPAHLTNLQRRGLEILWVKDNPYAVKKLIPVIEKYPDLGVVTLDDDIIYHPLLLAGLINKVIHEPGIAGYVGKAMIQKDSHLDMFFREPNPANQNTPSEQVYLIGWGGIYYPPNCLDHRVLDMDAVHRIVPGRGSDIWFWAAAHAKDTSQYCLGVPSGYNLGIPIPLNENTKPKDQPSGDVVPRRFQMAIDYFGIREKLLKVLPEKKQ
jgi:hypothetical protein